MQKFVHRAYNLNIEFTFICPELIVGQAPPQIVVEYGDVPVTLQEPRQLGSIFEASPNQFLLKLDAVGRFLVQNGNHITIDPHPNAAEAEVRLFLLSTCLTVILLQRGGMLPLHASGIHTANGCVLFLGYSGAGKSSLLAAMMARGYSMLSDDVVPIVIGKQGKPMALPAFPYMKLCADTVQQIGHNKSELSLIRRDTRVDKFGMPVKQFSGEISPVRTVYVLNPQQGTDIQFEVMDNAQKMPALLYRTAGMPFINGLGGRAEHFKLVTQFAASVTMKRVSRPISGSSVFSLADAIEGDLG